MATGQTPGGKGAWFGIQKRVDADFSGEIVRLWDAGTVGEDGTARIDLPKPISPRSLWAAVDVTSGEFDVAAPPGYRIAQPEKPGRLLAHECTACTSLKIGANCASLSSANHDSLPDPASHGLLSDPA